MKEYHEIDLKVYKYKWKKELEKSESDKKLIRDQIDSFIFTIKNSESFHSKTYLDEMTLFSKMVLSYEHIPKLEDDYKEKFKEINKFIKKEWDMIDIELTSFKKNSNNISFMSITFFA